MFTWERARFTAIATVTLGVGWLAWTLLLPWTSAVDSLWPFSAPSLESTRGQVSAAIAVVTMPLIVYGAMLVISYRASRRQLTSLAAALMLATALSFGMSQLTKELVNRTRPGSPWETHFTTGGSSYPSGHVTAITTAAVMSVIVASVTRRSRKALRWAQILGPLLVLVIAFDRLTLRVHYVSDVVGGLLLGGFTAYLACLLSGVFAPHRYELPAAGEGRRAAIIYNPTKIVDMNVFRHLVQRRLHEAGWEAPIWLATSPLDPGRSMSQAALDSSADLVLVAGGDGTVRIVSGQLQGTGTRMAIIPSGTGNLLARNLSIPLDMDHALDVALHGRTGTIDVIRVEVPGQDPDHAVVMCGVGADAAVINDTDEELKGRIGVGAYVVAALGHIRTRAVRTTVIIDDGEPVVRDSSLTMVCNVSDLQPGLTIAPAASACDGILDILVASPASQVELAALAAAVVAQAPTPPTLELLTGQKVKVLLDTEQLYQLDGDVAGTTGELNFQVLPGTLLLRLPD